MFATIVVLASIGQTSNYTSAGILVARVHAAQAKPAVPGKKTQAEITALAKKERERAIAKKQAGKAAVAAQQKAAADSRAMSAALRGLSGRDRTIAIQNMTGIRTCAGTLPDGQLCKVPVTKDGNGFCPQHGGK